jgi:malonyl-CoA decarboxylase
MKKLVRQVGMSALVNMTTGGGDGGQVGEVVGALSSKAFDRDMEREADMKGLLANWFDVGFLELRRIDWSSPAALLEKLVDYEAVHRIRTWRDLKNRLDSDRRCYAFFHPRMPEEPLIFVEVALVQGLSDSVQRLLDQKAPVLDPKAADTAIFYSINNCQRGLDGIAFGNFLIKRVVETLSGELRGLKHFSRISSFITIFSNGTVFELLISRLCFLLSEPNGLLTFLLVYIFAFIFYCF